MENSPWSFQPRYICRTYRLGNGSEWLDPLCSDLLCGKRTRCLSAPICGRILCSLHFSGLKIVDEKIILSNLHKRGRNSGIRLLDLSRLHTSRLPDTWPRRPCSKSSDDKYPGKIWSSIEFNRQTIPHKTSRYARWYSKTRLWRTNFSMPVLS